MGKKYHFVMNVPGASDEEKQRGLNAALKVFAEHGVDPVFAVVSHFKREGWDESGNAARAEKDDFKDEYDPTAKELDAAELLDVARDAALAACCKGWASIPADAGGFEMVPMETQAPGESASA